MIDGESCNTFFISKFRNARQTILGSALRSFTTTLYGYSLRFSPLDGVSCAKAPGVSPLAAPAAAAATTGSLNHTPNIDDGGS